MPRIIVFDVNETLLDVDALKPHFARAFGDELFCGMVLDCLALFRSGQSRGTILRFRCDRRCRTRMTAASRRVSLSGKDVPRFSAACDLCPRILRA